MTIHNETPFTHSLAIGLGPDRKARLAIAVKGTFDVPTRPDREVTIASEQREVVMADEPYHGDPTASIRLESEIAVYKPRTDVVLVGHAYTPRGTPATEVDVALRVGKGAWMMRVFGNRTWSFPTRLVVVPSASSPEPFTAMPLVYERAFGGADAKTGAPSAANPIGRGYIFDKSRESVDGVRLPNLEDPRQLIRSWDDRPDPVGWGYFGKSWQPRAAYGGADVENADKRFGIPSDFQQAYSNGAHPALQLPGFLSGDEEVEMRNVTPDGIRRFRLPGIRPRVDVATYTEPSRDDGAARPTRSHQFECVLDTIVFLPDENVFTLVWRAGQTIEMDLDIALSLISTVSVSLDSAETMNVSTQSHAA